MHTARTSSGCIRRSAAPPTCWSIPSLARALSDEAWMSWSTPQDGPDRLNGTSIGSSRCAVCRAHRKGAWEGTAAALCLP